jgi:hypothetical protein
MQPPNVSLLNRDVKLSNRQRCFRCSWSWKLRSCAVALVATSLPAILSVSLVYGKGGGNAGGHMSGPGNQNQPRGEGHYRDPFWGPWYPGYAGSYDSDYWYHPTPEQQTTAQKRVKAYLVAVKKGRRHAATHRYIAVETLRPTKTQLADYVKKRAEAKSAGTQLSSRWVEPSQLRCMMVFDTQSKQFVGSGCYVVGSLPAVGTVAKFETVSAEYVGTSAL